MGKLKISVSIINEDSKIENEIVAIKNDKFYIYKEVDDLKTKASYNYIDNILTRENESIKLMLDFKKSTATCVEKKTNTTLNFSLSNCKVSSDNLLIEYMIENNLFKYQIKEI